MLTQEKEKTKKSEEEKKSLLVDLSSLKEQQPSLRVTGVYGDVNEDKASETIYTLLHYDASTVLVKENPEDPESQLIEVAEPIDFYVSSHGGSATEMFSIYDMMRKVRETTPIHTHGIGKVMSAGVLLLAAGTRGKRTIGKNCRVMIHGVVSGQAGHLQDVENEFEEAKLTQKLYIKNLAAETDMTEKYIKRLMDKKTNVYLNAEKAVELGIADKVF